MRTARLLTVSQHALRRGGAVSQHALGRQGVYPSMHWAGVCVWGCLAGGVSGQGVSTQGSVSGWCLPRGGVCPGGCLPRGVSAQGGVCWGVSAGDVCPLGVCQGVSDQGGVADTCNISHRQTPPPP